MGLDSIIDAKLRFNKMRQPQQHGLEAQLLESNLPAPGPWLTQLSVGTQNQPAIGR
jgi:hypothetical protein